MKMPSVVEAARAIRTGALTSEALTVECIARIERHNPALNAFVHLDFDGALATARSVDRAVKAGGAGLGPLAGVPFGVKDLEHCAGMPTTRGSRWFVNGPNASVDDIHVARLRNAGAIPIGKTAAPEFGAWAYTASPLLGVTRNPWNTKRTPGGSSGGSSAAVSGRARAVLHCKRRRRFDPHARGIHRTRRTEMHVRAHPHVRRNAHRTERGRWQPRDDRCRHRVAARRDGRAGRARSHLSAAAARKLCGGARVARRARHSRCVVAGSRLCGGRTGSGRAVRARRARVDGGDRRRTNRREHSARRLHPHVCADRGRGQVRRYRSGPVAEQARRTRSARSRRAGKKRVR